MKRALLAAGATALLLVAATPAPALAATETCHPPRYDTVACVCRAAVFVLELVTDKDWQCDVT